jgi:hypothetical protein
MRIQCNGTTQTLEKPDLIAQGGEGLVFRDPSHPRSLGFKIYHEPTTQRERKLTQFLNSLLDFPEAVIKPLAAVTTDRGAFAGFQMRLLPGTYSKISRLFVPKFCADNGITLKSKVQIFQRIARDLNQIHAQRVRSGSPVVIGDFNGGSVMFHETSLAHAFVDVDSWGISQDFPCIVATQQYVAPDLYGIDLAKSHPFEPTHDWYSFCVLLMQSLLNGVHPFKSGQHAVYQSVVTRAQHGATVFDQEVTWPKIGLRPEILTDDLAHLLSQVFKRKERKPFPLQALATYGDILTECRSCGQWYPATRSHCPACTQKTILTTSLHTMVAGLQVVDLVVTQGRILHHQKVGEALYCIADEAGQLVLYIKESGQVARRVPFNLATPQGARFRLLDGLVVVCPSPRAEKPILQIYQVDHAGAKLIASTTTELMSGGRAVFGTSPRRLYRIAGRFIMAGERRGSILVERQVSQVLQGQAYFKVATEELSSRDIVFGCQREFADLTWFLIRSDPNGQTFNRMDVALPPLETGESLADVAIYFSREEVLVVRKTTYRGTERVHLETVSTEDGIVQLSRIRELNDAPEWETIHGKAFSRGLVMHITVDGVSREKLIDGTTSVLPNTEKYVTADDSLDRIGRGILVVKADRAVSIEPKK